MQQLKAGGGFLNMPKTFYMILLIEFWERFAFYGLQAIAVLFFLQKFNMTERSATELFSSLSALLYAFCILGGYLGDKVLGLTRTYLLGILFLIIGYASFGLVNDLANVYWGMGALLVGNILFKTTAGNLVYRCFSPDDPRIDVAFTYFYMSINFGSVFSMIIIPIVAIHTSYEFGLTLCSIGMVCALITYFIVYKRFLNIENDAGRKKKHKNLATALVLILCIGLSYLLGILLQHLSLSKAVLFTVGLAAIAIYWIVWTKVNKKEQIGMTVAFVLLMQSLVFWVVYMQMATSLTLFSVHNVNCVIFGINIPPELTQSFNPLWIFILSPILAYWYMYSAKKGKEMSIPSKFSIGLLVCGIAYLILAAGCYFANIKQQVPLIWLFSGYGLYSLGELLVSAIGLAMVSKLLPRRMGGFAQAMWFLFSALGQKFGGFVATFAAADEAHKMTSLQSLVVYQQLFFSIGIAIIIIGYVFLFFVKKLTTKMNFALA